MSKKPIKNKKFFFCQDGGTFDVDMIVVIGYSWNEFIAEIKKKQHAYSKKYIQQIESDSNLKDIWIKQHEDNTMGYPGLLHDLCNGNQILFSPRYSDEWRFWEMLMHEIHHAVQYESQRRGMEKENEALAYQHGYLFRKIRRKLQGRDKIS